MANPFFNAEYYLEQNADVAEAVGGDAAIAEQHYFLHGAREALEGINADRKPAPWFDIEFYRASNEKLADVPADQLFLHFTLHGIREGLSPMEGVVLDPVAYASAEGNEDLLEAFGITDVNNLTDEQVELLGQHFFAHGYKEGREGGPDIPTDVDLDDLTEALESLQDAVGVRNDFLIEAAKNEDVAETIEGDEDLTVAEAIEDTLEALTTELEAAQGEATEQQLAARVTVAEANLAAAQARHDAVVEQIKGLGDLVEDYRDATDELRALKGVRDEAQAGAVAQFEALKAKNADTEFNDLFDEDGNLTDTELSADGIVLAEFQEFETQPEGWPEDSSPAGRVVITADGLQVPGVSDLVNAVNSWLEASDDAVLQSAARAEIKASIEALEANNEEEVEVGSDSTFQNVLDRETELTEAQGAVTAREELVERVEAVQALADQLGDLDEDVDAAKAAIEELGYNLVEFDDTDFAEGTEDSDVFIYNFAEEATIDLFGAEGDDVLFIGTQFTYNDDIENGDNSALEVFLTQDGDNVLVTVETVEFGSNAKVPEVNEITLTGVSVDDVAFVDGYVVLV